jgi:hypothetical protein
MCVTSKYWTWIVADPNRGRKSTEVAIARKFLRDGFSGLELLESEIENQLLDQFRKDIIEQDDSIPRPAELCLRCFVSGAIEQACIQLELQFGKSGGFTRFDLFGFVLNDVDLKQSVGTQVLGRESNPQYTPLVVEILRAFDPQRSRLSTWTMRLVKQEQSLYAFLLERGIYLIGDWALLNDTRPPQLGRILGQFHRLAAFEIEQNQILLACYHSVYRSDRLKNSSGRCYAPSAEQLERIGDRLLLKTGQKSSPPEILDQLQTLATYLREYRLHRRRRTLPVQSLDEAIANPGERASLTEPDRAEETHQEFLTQYRQHLLDSLDIAIAEGVGDRIVSLNRKKSQKTRQFLDALHRLHCQGQAMSEIAVQIGLKAQYQISRLLALRQLRTTIRDRLIAELLSRTLKTAMDYTTPDNLTQLQEHLNIVLNEEIDEILAEAQTETEGKNKDRPLKSLFARRLCHFLDSKQPPTGNQKLKIK